MAVTNFSSYLTSPQAQKLLLKDGQLNLEPKKLTQFFVLLCRQPHSQDSSFEQLKQSIFRQLKTFYTDKTLSHYHWLKVLCHYPEEAVLHKQSFEDNIKELEQQLIAHPQDPSMMQKACKISAMISQNPALKGCLPQKNYLAVEVNVQGENQQLIFDRWRLGFTSPLLQSKLIQAFHSTDAPLDFSLRRDLLQLVQEFVINGKVNLSKVSSENIILLLEAATKWEMSSLIQSCLEALKKRTISGSTINPEYALKFLLLSLEHSHIPLRDACTYYLNHTDVGFNLTWTRPNHCEIALTDWKTDSPQLLPILLPYTQLMRFDNESVLLRFCQWNLEQKYSVKLEELDITACQNGQWEMDSLESMRHAFAKVKTLALESSAYTAFSKHNNLSSWDHVETLILKDTQIHTNAPPNVFPNIQSCVLIEYSSQNEKEKIRSFGNALLIDCSKEQGLYSLFKTTLGIGKVVALDFTNKTQLTDAALIETVLYYSALTSLVLTGCTRLTDQGISSAIFYRPSITSLSACCQQLTDACLEGIAECSKTLEAILLGTSQVTSKGISTLANKHRGLKVISLNDCQGIDDQAVISIAVNCPELTALNLNNCSITDQAAVAIASGCKKLKVLSFLGCSKLTDDSVHQIATNCPELFDLSLNKCTLLTNQTVHSIVGNLKYIHSLSLKDCTNLNDEAVDELANNCTGWGLKSLSLGGLNNITNKAIIHLAEACSQLQQLSLSRLSQLTNESISKVVSSCQKLKGLSVHNCSNLDDAALLDIAEHLSFLTFLDISGCPLFTDNALVFLAKKLPHLTLLKGSFSKPISERISQIIPACKIEIS